MKPTLTLLALLAAANCCGAQTISSDDTNLSPVVAVHGLNPLYLSRIAAMHPNYTLTYTTNVVEGDNLDDLIMKQWEYYHHQWVPLNGMQATERTWTTNVTEHLVVTLRVNGEDRTLEQSRVVSSKSYTERLESKWVAKDETPEQRLLRLLNENMPTWSVTNWGGDPNWSSTNCVRNTTNHGGRTWTNPAPRPKHWPATNAYLMESPK